MERKTLFADVLLPLAIPGLYTYRVPVVLNEMVREGARVLVPFKNKFYSALVKNLHETPSQGYQAKYLEDVLDNQPVVNEKQFRLWDWMAEYYLCYPGEVMNAALPSGLRLSSETKLCINKDAVPSDEVLQSLSDNQLILYEAIEKRNVLTFTEAADVLSVKNPQPVIKQLLKPGLILLYEEVQERYKPKLVSYIQLSDTYRQEEALQQLFSALEKRAFKQVELLLFYLKETKRDSHDESKWLKKNILLKHFDSTVISSLVKKGVFIEQDFETGRLDTDNTTELQKQLSAVQLEAHRQIKKAFDQRQVSLLHGITGSGKTEIYISLIEEALQQNKQVLYLVPEIALTTQLIGRVKKYFGNKVGVYHSRFSENERVEIWNSLLEEHNTDMLNRAEYQIILGARSALFLPFSNLGLVIIDEEHDPSYKQHDPAPRYHARDTAIYLASLHKANVILGTATPSIESYYNAQQGKYTLVELKERYGKSTLPIIEVLDTKSEKANDGDSITPPLLSEIKNTLAKKEQVILFQNRRGFAPYTECFTCGHIPHCVQCDVSLIYHKATQKLTCHYCGYTTVPPKVCPACQSPDLRFRGFGTQKIEEEIELLLPDVKVKRMDIDSTRSKHAYRQLIDEFDNGNIDILVGTQMLTKGLDFDNVGLVGVLQADHLLNYPDFRSYERAFQLLTQVSGRAGRKEKKGRVLIQTTQTQHPVIEWVIKHNYEGMYKAQIAERQEYLYPPFSRLFSFTCIHKDMHTTAYAADWLASALRKNFPEKVLGPQFPLVSRIKNLYHKQVLLKVERNLSAQAAREQLHKILAEFRGDKLLSQTRLKIDVDSH